MSEAKITASQFIDFLIASPLQATATEAQRIQPDSADPAAHDAYTRLPHRLESDSDALWVEVQPEVRRTTGVLVPDDSVLDKPNARKMELVHPLGSGTHHLVVEGIARLTLWTDGDRHSPCDDQPNDQKTKNDHFGDLIRVAQGRGFAPEHVRFDGWYSGVEDLKRLRTPGWNWLTRLKGNRRVNPDRTGSRAVSVRAIAATGTVVRLKGSGFVKVFRIAAKDGTTERWATSNLPMVELERLRLADASWRIEGYHCGLEQVTNVERCECRKGAAQRGHIGLALRTFVVIEQCASEPASTGSQRNGRSSVTPFGPTGPNHFTAEQTLLLRNSYTCHHNSGISPRRLPEGPIRPASARRTGWHGFVPDSGGIPIQSNWYTEPVSCSWRISST